MATRNNGKGMNGVAQNVKLLSVRAVPDGDEYDKDVALAIRYAVDNGAKVINMSFGKQFSTHSNWVRGAIAYAAKNDVLIVAAAGNDAQNTDEINYFPNDQIDNGEEVWLTSPRHRIKMVAKLGQAVRKGNLFTTFHFPEIGLNSVLSASADCYTHCPEYKVQAVSIEKV